MEYYHLFIVERYYVQNIKYPIKIKRFVNVYIMARQSKHHPIECVVMIRLVHLLTKESEDT